MRLGRPGQVLSTHSEPLLGLALLNKTCCVKDNVRKATELKTTKPNPKNLLPFQSPEYDDVLCLLTAAVVRHPGEMPLLSLYGSRKSKAEQ